MKKLANPINVIEVEGEGLHGLLGKRIIVWCMNYNYAGILDGVNETCIKLKDAGVVYETGKLDGALKDFQKTPNNLYVQLSAIEAFYKIS